MNVHEITFRGYTVAERKWVYGNLIEKDGAYYILEKTIGMHSSPNRKTNICDGLGGRFRFELHCVEPESIGQYTGLQDKDGRKIFSGDIVRLYDDDLVPQEVFFCDGCFCIGRGEEVVMPLHYKTHCLYCGETLNMTEIVGNTYTSTASR